MFKIIFFIWRIPKYIDTFKTISKNSCLEDKSSLPLFLRFINLLINDATYLLDESLGVKFIFKQDLVKIKELEHEITTSEFAALEEEAKKEVDYFLTLEIKEFEIFKKDSKIFEFTFHGYFRNCPIAD